MMIKTNLTKKFSRSIFVFLAILFFLFAARGERLPIRAYTSADGLASSSIPFLKRDSLGFLWLCTRDGISRFDGREFTNYRLRNSASAQTLFYFFETRQGVYWFSASDGLYRIERKDLNEVKPASFEPNNQDHRLLLDAVKVSDISFSVMYEDRAGRLWGGQGAGLFLITDNGSEPVTLQKIELDEAAKGSGRDLNITDIYESGDESLWMSCRTGALRRLPDERVIHYPVGGNSTFETATHLKEDADGRIWLGHSAAAFVFQPESIEQLQNAPAFSSHSFAIEQQLIQNSGRIDLPNKPGRLLKLLFTDPKTGSQNNEPSAVHRVFQLSDKKIYIPVSRSLFVISGNEVRRFSDSEGLPNSVTAITDDLQENIWLGTSSGAFKLTRQGFTTFTQNDGLISPNINSVYQAADNSIYAAHGDWRVSRFTENGFESIKLDVPNGRRVLWASNAVLLDSRGDWWALSDDGLFQFANFKLKKTYTEADGLKSSSTFCAFEDSAGNIWVSTRRNSEDNGLSRFDRETGKFYTFSEKENFPAGKSPQSFAEDAQKNLWFGFYQAGLTRFRDGRFENFGEKEGFPENASVPWLFVDSRGRLWIASGADGVFLVENPGADKPSFKHLTTAEGLASNNVRRFIEDSDGNIYIGSVRGIDRLNPETGQIKHFSTLDGLAADFVSAAFRDRSGVLWFGTPNGLSRFEPQKDIEQIAPRVFISGLQIAGVRYGVSEFGQTEIGALNLNSAQNNFQFNFLSVGDALRYQYRLEGADKEWSAPVSERTVNFANLAPGSYRFLVRAVNNAGLASEKPAAVSFTIRPPFWRAWEFLTALIILIVASVFALDRYRVHKTRQVERALAELQQSERERRTVEAALRKSREERLAELERVRTRIATDLHDDIGSSLTQIAVLSQMAHGQLAAAHNSLETPLERISTVSVELVNAMSDIVWAINPRKDNLRDLVQRMRRFAADVFSARGIKFEFDAPDVENQLQLGANIRREVFAIFKEAVNNAVKHSGCTRAEISLKIVGGFLILQISDNGAGFDSGETLHLSQPPTGSFGGNGLINLRKRGRELGGKCEIISFPGGGTSVLLEIPLHYEKAIQTDGDANGANGLH